jgi:valyl-tRNA synthetase
MNYNQVMDQVKALAKGNSEIVDNVEKYIQRLEEDKNSYLNQLLDTRHQLFQKDYLVENQANVIENTRKTLESYERENKHLRALVREWI